MKRLVAHLIFLIWLVYGCKHDQAKLIPVDSCNSPVVVSFSSDLVPLFSKNCALSGCHSGAAPASNLNLEPAVAYTQLMNHSKGYVDTIHPLFSLLYAQMTSVSTPMPPTGNLSSCNTALVLKWIQQKAKNN